MLMIRLARIGARKQPYYRVVVIEKERARNGRSLEVVGTYNPRTSPTSIDLKRERIEHWLSKGARMSDRTLTPHRIMTMQAVPCSKGNNGNCELSFMCENTFRY